jgi:transposase-like protein
VDETFIGGKARNMHKHVRARKITGTGGTDKTAVLGFIERGGEVRVEVIPNTERPTLHPRIYENIEKGAAVYTDALKFYSGLEGQYAHETVDHAERYVDGCVHTNGMENFWSLHKRGLHGTYISVEPFHLFRYLDERAFTFNQRDLDDLGRFESILRTVAGRRLTFAEVTGKA